ncbi:VCBS domain-containing protein, partial [Veronia pacifica]
REIDLAKIDHIKLQTPFNQFFFHDNFLKFEDPDEANWHVKTFSEFKNELASDNTLALLAAAQSDDALARADIPASISGITEGVMNGDEDVVTGTLLIQDSDKGQSPSFPNTTVEGKYGSLTLIDRIWTYTLDPDKVAPLKDGEVDSDVITLTATDGSQQNITVTITGKDDLPEIQGASQSTLDEGVLVTSGEVSLFDPDADVQPTLNDVKLEGLYGTLTLTNGRWTYQADPDKVRPLDGDETALDSFTVSASDNTTHSITITVTGSEDAPVVSGLFSANLTETDIDEALPSATGTLAITDADTADTPAFPDTVVDGQYGSLALKDGEWTYTLDRAKSGHLTADDTVEDTLTLTATDNTVQVITISITGTDTTAIITGQSAATLEKGETAANGQIALFDPDAEVQPTLAAEQQPGLFGTLILNGDGSWQYQVDPEKIVPLDEGETATDTFTFIASDGSSHDIVLTVTGSEDTAIVSGIFSQGVTEPDNWETPVTATGTLSITDPDTADTPAFANTSMNG